MRWTVLCGMVAVVVLALAAPCRAREMPDYAPADPQLPVPLGSTRPELPNKAVFVGRPTASHVLRALRLTVRDTMQLLGPEDYPGVERCSAFGRWTEEGFEIVQLEPPGPAVVGRFLLDEEDWRLTGLSGALSGFQYERYLGHGFAFRLSAGVHRASERPFLAPAIDWWLTEQLRYTFGFDPVAGCGVSCWQFEDEQ
jgi:hypothetical protein